MTSRPVLAAIGGAAALLTAVGSPALAAAAQPEAAQPEAAQPEVAQPEVAQPEVAQPQIDSALAAQGKVVSAVPASGTPQISDGAVFAVAQVGTTIVVGGSFHSATSASGGATYNSPYILAFDATTGAVRTAFRPQLDDKVQALLPGPTAGTVYVGGEFNNVAGAAAKSLTLLNLSDGSRVNGFRMPATNGVVQTVQRRGDRLYVGGSFTKVGGQVHGGLVTLDASSGDLDPFMASNVAINHNWTPSSPPGNAKAPVGVTKLDISPDGSKLVAIGNFKQVDGTPHDQIAMWDLGAGAATLRDWRTTALEAPCLVKTYDTYARDVSFSPDGSYFALVDTGGYKAGSLCDAASRWETSATGQDVQPTWVDYTGGDSLLSTTVTGEAVYVGGHQRWLNNGQGSDKPGPGAVPRPGVAALDPANGVPLAWNPGRNPRGAGTYVLFATAKGLWMGSDTDYIGTNSGGNTRYTRKRIAYFPLAGGRPAASKALAQLPATVFVGTGKRSFTGTSAGPVQAAGAPLDPTAVHGTTFIGGTLFYTSGSDLYSRTLTAGTWGPQTLVDPYDDPVWSTVKTGSGGLLYRGTKPAFYALIPSLTSMFYDGSSRLYYTVQGKTGLYSRAFSPDSGTIQSQEKQVPGVSLPPVTGAFVTGGQLYYATAADGNLHRASFGPGGVLGPQTVVSGPAQDGVDWRNRVLFVAPR